MGLGRALWANRLDVAWCGLRDRSAYCDQELWWPGSESKYIRSIMRSTKWDGSLPACVVSGGLVFAPCLAPQFAHIAAD